MKDRFNSVILIGILICLIVIAFKPVPSFNLNSQPMVNQIDSGFSVFTLGENRLAVVDTRSSYGSFGTLLTFDYDSQKNTYNLKSKFDFSDYFRNPQKYGLGNAPDPELTKAIDDRLDAIVSNPKVQASSNPYDYIQGNADYDYIIKLGKSALECLLYRFASTETDGLKEYIMAAACAEISQETDKNWRTGREWYVNFLKTHSRG